ncbi:MAG TPA: hypothetical protein VES02_18990 [Dermatophilaceae bacterium]|nr:hypothetical protein [Dermatophilaceae bacterium]
MSTHRSSRVLLGLVGAATVAALVVPGAAFAKGPGGGGGGGGEETTANSLSVPAVFVGANPFSLTCDGTWKSPDGQTPKSGYTLAGYYYVQGVNTWQAQCDDGLEVATATAAFGDNLTGTAKKAVGSPIRVEIGLFESPATPMTGWDVVKLEPSQLDRVSPYGTLATETSLGVFASNPVTTLPTRVWAPGTLKVYLQSTPGSPVVNTSATAEINSTGKVVFGYNLKVTAPGTYVIEYTFPAVTITTVPKGTITNEGHTVSLPIVVTSGGGGGGRK